MSGWDDGSYGSGAGTPPTGHAGSGPEPPRESDDRRPWPFAPRDWTVVRRRFSHVGAGLSVMLLLWISLQLIVYALLALVVPRSSDGSFPTWMTLLSSSGPLYLVAMPLSLVVLTAVPRLPTRGFSMGAGEFVRLLVVCVPLMYAGSIIGSVLAALLSGGTASNGLDDLLLGSDTPTVMLFVVILAPIFEEWMFRKQIIDRLRAYGERTAILISALAFALFHLNIYQFFYAFGLGLVFGYAYMRTSRLRYSVAMHMIINLNGSVIAPWILSLLGKDTLDAIDSGSIQAVESAVASAGVGVAIYLVYAFALMAVIILGVVILVRDRRRIEFYVAPYELGRGVRARTAFLNPGMVVYAVLCLSVMVITMIM